jgi:hypothetical protein
MRIPFFAVTNQLLAALLCVLAPLCLWVKYAALIPFTPSMSAQNQRNTEERAVIDRAYSRYMLALKSWRLPKQSK